MRKFIPREKLGKKDRKELDSSKRQLWGINPVTRKSGDKVKYDRRKARGTEDIEGN